jgi:hypothetical protein
VKLKLNLSLSAKRTQRWAHSGETEHRFALKRPTAAPACKVRKNSPFDLLTTRTRKPVRIPAPILAARPGFRGDKSYLRALRAAELACWNANIKFPMFGAILLAASAHVSS